MYRRPQFGRTGEESKVGSEYVFDEAVELGCVEVGRSDSTLAAVVDHEQAGHDAEWYERYGMDALPVGYGFEDGAAVDE